MTVFINSVSHLSLLNSVTQPAVFFSGEDIKNNVSKKFITVFGTSITNLQKAVSHVSSMTQSMMFFGAFSACGMNV